VSLKKYLSPQPRDIGRERELIEKGFKFLIK